MFYDHYVYYYGRKDINEVKNIINQYHKSPKDRYSIIEPVSFLELETRKNKVYFVDYDMVQSEITMISKGRPYNIDLIPTAKVFNEYFGSGLSSIVFQEIRESKALAYSARSYFSTPNKLNKAHYVTAYLGTQVDKLSEAILLLSSEMSLSAVKNTRAEGIVLESRF